ncbi:conserved exported hypothetical protein [Candidatus Sulfotelmatobacter kueseliae]|uniref:Uncharacterized protein n=1 Tax=Candidatus Sulfotelmatobacter kueseliae TaxID=2042962 RepID=A0A2U3K3E9_9BACT|nr:conserved exported hypothetical protein [Candidatus Sulfotelmatobacter kueseliae]
MRPLCCVLLVSGLMSVLAVAQSPFDGVWKAEPTEIDTPRAPEVYLLQDGAYRCPTCDPPLDVRADGRDQKVTGEPCYDTVGLQVVDDRTTLETDKRSGKTVGTSKMTVSSDGNSATIDWKESCNVNGDVVSETFILSRVAKGPRGSHAVSGSWQIVKRVNMSENAMVATLKLEGDTFSFVDPAGMSYAAKLDGTETPIKGDLSQTTVSVKRIGENTIEETDKRDGKVVEVIRFTPSPDGKTMTISIEDKVKGGTRQFVAHKQ